MPPVNPNDRSVVDPALRQAVVDLFRASEAFSSAYADFERSAGRDRKALEALAFAEARVDLARERVSSIQSPDP